MSKVQAAGFRLVHPLDVLVTVSARIVGRAKGGMADCLSAWLREEAEGVPVLFECPGSVEERLRKRKALRDLAPGSLPDPQSAARDPASRARQAAALIERLASDDPDAEPTVPALVAISAVEDRIATLRGIADAA